MPPPLCTTLKRAIGYAHRTKREQGANCEGTSGGAEGNMLDEILADLIDNERMKIKKAIIDKDASCQEVLLSRSPETEIVYCGNHTDFPYRLGTSEENSLSGMFHFGLLKISTGYFWIHSIENTIYTFLKTAQAHNKFISLKISKKWAIYFGIHVIALYFQRFYTSERASMRTAEETLVKNQTRNGNINAFSFPAAREFLQVSSHFGQVKKFLVYFQLCGNVVSFFSHQFSNQ